MPSVGTAVLPMAIEYVASEALSSAVTSVSAIFSGAGDSVTHVELACRGAGLEAVAIGGRVTNCT